MKLRNSYQLAMVAFLVLALFAAGLVTGCGKPKEVTLAFVPSDKTDQVITNAAPLKDYLEKEMKVKINLKVPSDYTATIQALKTGQADFAAIATLAYVIAQQETGAQLLYKSVRFGSTSYRGQITIRKEDSGKIKSIADLKGKTVAITDTVSTSGYLFPLLKLQKAGIDYKDTKQLKIMEAGSHPAALIQLYQKKVDAAFTYEDARDALVKDYPDVKEKLVPLDYTDSIPNDTIVARKDLDPKLVEKFKAAMDKIIAMPAADKKSILKVYSWDDIAPAKDSDYNVVRDVVKQFNYKIAK